MIQRRNQFNEKPKEQVFSFKSLSMLIEKYFDCADHTDKTVKDCLSTLNT